MLTFMPVFGATRREATSNVRADKPLATITAGRAGKTLYYARTSRSGGAVVNVIVIVMVAAVSLDMHEDASSRTSLLSEGPACFHRVAAFCPKARHKNGHHRRQQWPTGGPPPGTGTTSGPTPPPPSPGRPGTAAAISGAAAAAARGGGAGPIGRGRHERARLRRMPTMMPMIRLLLLRRM